jgi:hypothetical protein
MDTMMEKPMLRCRRVPDLIAEFAGRKTIRRSIPENSVFIGFLDRIPLRTARAPPWMIAGRDQGALLRGARLRNRLAFLTSPRSVKMLRIY